MGLTHELKVDPHQLDALAAGETLVLIIAVDQTNVQKGDTVRAGPGAGELPLAPYSELVVRRVHPGTKANGIVPGFAVIEVRTQDALLIEGNTVID